MIDPVSLVKDKSWIISNFDDWKAMRKDIEDALEFSIELDSVYSRTLSPWVNNGRTSELRKQTVVTGVWLDISQPHGEVTEYEMEKGEDGKPRKKLVNGKPVVKAKYYALKGKPVKYRVTICDTTRTNNGVPYTSPAVRYSKFEDRGVLGVYRRVYVSGTIEAVE